MVVGTVTSLELLLVGSIVHPIVSGYTFAIIVSTGYHDLLDFISICTHIDRDFQIAEYDSICTTQTN